MTGSYEKGTENWTQTITEVDGIFLEQRGAGPALVLVHGQPGSSTDWDLLASHLPHGARIIRYDRPGWGNSGFGACGIWENGEILGSVLRSAGGPPPVIAGYSFGAAVAVATAQRYPELVGELILINPAVTMGALRPLDRVLALPVIGDFLTLAGFILGGRALWMLDRHGSRLPGALRGRLGPFAGSKLGLSLSAKGRPWAAFSTEQRALLIELASLEAGLSKVKSRVAIVAGTRDRVVPSRAVEELCTMLPSANLTWLSGGHLLPWTAPRTLSKIIGEILQN